MPYVVVNKSDRTVKLKIEDYPKGMMRYSDLTDTIIDLKPNEKVTVKVDKAIGFPWETEKIYRLNPGTDNFDLLINDSIVKLDKSDNNWSYNDKSSIFKIEKKHVLQ
jgi:hypothetical protein